MEKRVKSAWIWLTLILAVLCGVALATFNRESNEVIVYRIPMDNPQTNRAKVPVTAKIPKALIGKGIWINHIQSCFGGNVDALVRQCVISRIDYIIIKTSVGGDWSGYLPAKRFADLVVKFHTVGIRVFAWAYIYGSYPDKEAARSIDALKLGADGVVWNVESEFTRDVIKKATKKSYLPRSPEVMTQKAELLCATTRTYVDQNKPHAVLAYCSFCNIKRWRSKLPFKVFGYYSDMNKPQAYWRTLKKKPDEVVKFMFQQWYSLEREWQKNGLDNSIKPIVPVGHAYRQSAKTEYIPPSEMVVFAKAAQGYYGVSWYVADYFGPEHWATLRDLPGRPEKIAQLFGREIKPKIKETLGERLQRQAAFHELVLTFLWVMTLVTIAIWVAGIPIAYWHMPRVTLRERLVLASLWLVVITLHWLSPLAEKIASLKTEAGRRKLLRRLMRYAWFRWLIASDYHPKSRG